MWGSGGHCMSDMGGHLLRPLGGRERLAQIQKSESLVYPS